MKTWLRIGGAVLASVSFVALTVATDARAEEQEEEATSSGKGNISWRYIEAGHAYVDFDEGISSFGDDGHGVGFSLRFTIRGPVHLAGDYTWAEGRDSADATVGFFGLGISHEVADAVDVYAQGGWRYEEVEEADSNAVRPGDGPVFEGSEADDGEFRVGVRGMVIPKVEVGAQANYSGMFSGGLTEVFSGTVSARYYLLSGLAVGTSVNVDDEANIAVISGFRLDFDRLGADGSGDDDPYGL